MEQQDLTIWYRVRPLHAPLRFCKIETYPTLPLALQRKAEMLYSCTKGEEAITVEIDRVKRGTGCLFITTILKEEYRPDV